MDPKLDDSVEFFAKPADFERWLRKHQAKASCIWVKYAKKKSGISPAKRPAVAQIEQATEAVLDVTR